MLFWLRGLWDKYGLVMDEEIPMPITAIVKMVVSDFKRNQDRYKEGRRSIQKFRNGKQFRYDLIKLWSVV